MPRLGLGQSLTGGAASGPNLNFESTWATTGSDETVTLPFVNDGNTINFTIDWGDGSSDSVTAYNNDLGEGAIDHVYSTAATYTIKMAGTISGFKFDNGGHRTKLKTITNWGSFNISTNDVFYGCSALTVSAEDAPTISTTDFQNLFRDCSVFNTDISSWDVSNVTTFYGLFQNCTAFNNGLGCK